MSEMFTDFVNLTNKWAWGPVMICLLVGTGIYLTVRLRFVQLRYIFHSVKCISGKYDDPDEPGDITHFQALCAALSATIGIGNIAGVATAISIGGPGAVFWMWVTAFVGMATKFSSCSLALKYRAVHKDGSVSGGPMYTLAKGLNLPWLGFIFALMTGFASLGAGCAVQANSVVDGIRWAFPGELWNKTIVEGSTGIIGGIKVLSLTIGIVLAIGVGVVIIGGIKRIAQVASKIVPFMSLLYIFGALFILFLNRHQLPSAFGEIFKYAFSPFALGGGFLGVVIQQTLRIGVARGVFSNESGLGSAPMAHAAAATREPIREGFVALLEPLVDTLIICTMTALVIISTGAWQVKASDGTPLYAPGAKSQIVELSLTSGVNADEATTATKMANLQFKSIIDDKLTDREIQLPLDKIKLFNFVTTKTLTQDDATTTIWQLAPLSATTRAVRKFPNNEESREFLRNEGMSDEEIDELLAKTITNDELDEAYHFYAIPTSSSLTIAAFHSKLGKWGTYIVCFGLVLFAFSTMISWSYYGDRSWEYMLGEKAIMPYRYVFCIFIVIGAIFSLDMLWKIADTLNVTMAIPNLICLLLLGGMVAKESKDYIQRMKKDNNF